MTTPPTPPPLDLSGADPLVRSVAALVASRLFEPSRAPRFGRFTLLEHIGEGGMGVVFLAYDPQLDRRVALKLQRAAGDDDQQRRLLREAKALARLAHPNIVAVFEAGEHDGQVWLVMEYVRGRTLDEWRRHAAPGWRAIVDVLLQAGEGLAAAHGAGVIHRDFKPTNVIVGDDGRVRVMDFGLARLAAIDGVSATDALAPAPDGATTTRGTPGYAAPEVRAGRPADALADVYGYSVVLAELLYGAAPAEVADAAAFALLRRRATAVPAWLGPIVARGLERDPAARWPSMRAMIAALARDPAEIRRRRLRLAGLMLLVGLVVAAAVLGGLALTRHLAREAIETRAADHLAALADAEDPDAALARFLAEPDHRGTRAIARAWHRRGDQELAAGRDDAALAAYARAYAAAEDPADGRASARALADLQRRRWDGPALAYTLRGLQDHGAADPELAVTAALLLRDLPGAAAIEPDAAWASLLAALAPARRTPLRAGHLYPIAPGGDAAYLALEAGERAASLVGPDARVLHRWHAGDRVITPVRGTSMVFASRVGDEITLRDLHAPDIPLWRIDKPEAATHAAFGATLGGAEILAFTQTWPVFGFHRLRGLHGPTPTVTVAHAGTAAASSELSAAWIGDLDRDGRDELFVQFGAWNAFDLRVFRTDEHGELTLVDRRMTGRVTAMTPVTVAGERLLATFKYDAHPSVDLFPEPPHTGPPGGLHLLRWTGSRLEEVEHMPFPAHSSALTLLGNDTAVAADLDGDGVEELVTDLRPVGRAAAWILRQGASGWTSRVVAGVVPLGARERGGDVAAGLLVRIDDDDAVWILGAGDETLPPLAAAPFVAPPAAVDPWLAARWSRAEELAAMGLVRASAEQLAELADYADYAWRAPLRGRAAALFVAAGDDARAVTLDRPEPGRPPDPAALGRRAAALIRLGRYDEALIAARALAAAPADETDAALARTQIARSAPLAAHHDLDLARPLAPAWRFRQPAAVRHDRVHHVLEITTAAPGEPVAELPLAWDGEALGFAVELDVSRLETSGCLVVHALDDAGTSWLAAGVCGTSTGQSVAHELHCSLGMLEASQHQVVASALTPRRLVVRAARFADGHALCALSSDTDLPRFIERSDVAAPAGGLRLALGAAATNSIIAGLAHGAVRRLTLHGVMPTDAAPPTARDVAAHQLVAGDSAAAATVDGADAALLRLFACERLGDLAGVRRELEPLRPHLASPAGFADLALLIRTSPIATAALFESPDDAIVAAQLAIWINAINVADRDLLRVGLRELEVLTALAPAGPDAIEAINHILSYRGEMWEAADAPAAARRDMEAALALLDRLPPERRRISAAGVHFSLAQFLATLDPDGAVRHARAALALSPPEYYRDVFAYYPALAPALADPAAGE